MIILCKIMGLKGVLWAGPTADGLAFLLALAFVIAEMKKINAAAAVPKEERSLREEAVGEG